MLKESNNNFTIYKMLFTNAILSLEIFHEEANAISFYRWRNWDWKSSCKLLRVTLLIKEAELKLGNSTSKFQIIPLYIVSTYKKEMDAAAAAKSLQSCPTLCNPIDGSPPGSSVPGILQAIILEWVAIPFSNAWKWKVKVKSLSRVQLFATPWTVAYQALPLMGFSRQEYWNGLSFPSPGNGWWAWKLKLKYLTN